MLSDEKSFSYVAPFPAMNRKVSTRKCGVGVPLGGGLVRTAKKCLVLSSQY